MDISEVIAATSKHIVKLFKQACEALLKDPSSIVAREHWVKLAKNHLKIFNRAVKHGDVSHNTLKTLHSNIAHLKRFTALLKNYHVGMGNSSSNRVQNKTPSRRVKWEEIESSFASRIRSGVVMNLKHKDIFQFLADAFSLIKRRIKNLLKNMSILKVKTNFCGEFIKKSNEVEISDYKYFNTRNHTIDVGTSLVEWFQEFVVDKIFNKLSEFQERDSGWALYRIISLEVNFNKVEISTGGTSYIELPDPIRRKHACVNVKNNDNACFAWAVMSALYCVDKNSCRTTSYPNPWNVLQFSDSDMPMQLGNIHKFEKLNDISINVFGLELIENKKKTKHFYRTVPVRLTNSKRGKHVNLLLAQDKYYPKLKDYEMPPVTDSDEDDGSSSDSDNLNFHYVWIKNLSRLVASQTSKHKGTLFICDRCLNYFQSKERLEEHTEYCEQRNKCKISFPKDPLLQFKDFRYKEKTPFVIYADFETLLVPFSDRQSNSKTSKYQKHEAYSCGLYFKCEYDDSLSFFKSNRSESCVQWFVDEIEQLAEFVDSKLKNVEELNVQVDFKDIVNYHYCHICEKKFQKGVDKIVRDHNHFTGEFRGFAHSNCNLNYKNVYVVPVICHNLIGFDSHIIFKDIAKNNRVSLLPINKEKYISFTIHTDTSSELKFRFIDSFRFLATSLDKLVEWLGAEICIS
ncbi:unnamed protein product [Callosobruchus maculatus]|uniref:DNA-directed DNA polymerase n=1 Tax=Callosobruchus maculatus TaxID=64391 RepID=A0A653C1N6_CALMS|nr:unnamed protein product [Callosobruchus maculatus]